MIRRRKAAKFGTERAPRRDFPAHRQWVRGHQCVAAHDPNGCDGRIECAHVRIGTDGATGLKPSDSWTVAMCQEHHRIQHLIGEPEFERQMCVNLKALAMEFARRSPCVAMREAMKEAGGP